MIVTAGKTNVSAFFYIVQDASNTSPGEPITGLLFSDIETGGSASYARQGAVRTDLTLVTQTVAGAHTDGGFVEVDATNMPGVYRCDYPDLAFATGADEVALQVVVVGSKNAVAAPLKVQLLDVDLRGSLETDVTAILLDTSTTLENHLTDIKGTAFVKDTHSLTDIEAFVDAIDVIAADITALNDVSNANVLTQINTALDTAISELSQGAPTATPSLRNAAMLLYMALRNKSTVTATERAIHNDAGTKIAKSTISDAAGTFTDDEMVSGA